MPECDCDCEERIEELRREFEEKLEQVDRALDMLADEAGVDVR